MSHSSDRARAAIRVPEDFPTPGGVAGRRVVVTGGSRGLGLVISAAFVRAGARVVMVSRDVDDLSEAAKGLAHVGEVLVYPADVSRPEDNEAVADLVTATWGGLDVWIANAGISPIVAGPLRTDPATWKRTVDVNLSGAFYGARAAARVMGNGGRIIMTASVLGERPHRGMAAYSASKAGVIALVKALALDLADCNITVNAVSPGWFDSPLTEPWRRDHHLEKAVLEHTAMQRWGRSEDLAGAYLFLASDAAAFITGVVLTVDGGYLCI